MTNHLDATETLLVILIALTMAAPLAVVSRLIF
jgi:hypothetical protein